ncbi:MAG: molybdopterin-guanine dinucleotide biosynthesis protein MobB, partial [Desulfobulbaceae bacterium]|nr:molybdopterin-guanine dinucleotide biosynthesis protein MobB [Desulfobulbaceae bacterium]
YFGEVDIVITEGYKSGPAPKIEIFRSTAHRTPLVRDHTWIALVSDTEIDCELPVFTLDNAEGVAHFLIDTLISSRKQSLPR